MCDFFFEKEIDCGNTVRAMKVEDAIVASRYEAIGTAHEEICHLVVVDDQE